MMRLKVFKYIIILFYVTFTIEGQNNCNGFVSDSLYNPIEGVRVVDLFGKILTSTNADGNYHYSTLLDTLIIVFKKDGFKSVKKNIVFNNDVDIIEHNVQLVSFYNELTEVNLISPQKNNFNINYLTDYSANKVYSGKKNELIILQDNPYVSSNNSRSIYSKAVSLNIYQTDDVGLQLNIGGRGLDPRRSSNFKVLQNGYDISADPLGYPESYYTPPFEAIKSIELIRGAASLQYGTQFGGCVNFNFKTPNKNKKIEVLTRNTIGSNNLYTNFTSFSGTLSEFSYYTFFNHKKGDGFRSNSDFISNNLYSMLTYNPNNKIKISAEFTYLNYLAHQSGGLTDQMFYDDIFQSNRHRNWFSVNWLLYNMQADYSISKKTTLSFNVFYLDAYRYAVGFRSNRVDQIDSFKERDLIKADFKNIGCETRLLQNYTLFNLDMVSLIGGKVYFGKNATAQGPGSSGVDADFSFHLTDYPNYENQSEYSNPNINYSFFGENIIYFTDKLSFTPGVRFEFIQTESDGYYRDVNTDAAGNVILNETISTNDIRKRSFILYGIGLDYKFTNSYNLYANLSQNYRAVTFSDLNIINPSFIINPNIKDENGFTFDLGLRGRLNNTVLYDVSSFYLFYNDRIGFVQRALNDGSVKNEKGNVGNAEIYGCEMLINFNIDKLLNLKSFTKSNYYINFSSIQSKYISSNENGVAGNEVEYIPKINLKTGLELSFKNYSTTLQYTFLSRQFTDATNSVNSDLSGVIGEIPSYGVLDFSCMFLLKNIQLECGVNNILDRYYFTNRATGYPGPGIIPSPNRNYYITIQYLF